MPTPRPRSGAAQRERQRQNRLRQIAQHAARALDGHHDALHIQFHHDDELHVTVTPLQRSRFEEPTAD